MGKTPANTDVQFWRDPDLLGVEVRYSSYNKAAFCKHSHTAYSIGLIETGRTSFFLDGAVHNAVAGQIALINPGAVHACNPDLDSGMTYLMFYVDTSWFETLAAEVGVGETGLPHFASPVVDDPDLLDRWRALHTAITDGAERLEKETLLVQGLADLILRHAEVGVTHLPAGNEGAVLMVKEHLAANLTEKVSLDVLSEMACLSRYHLLRVFQDAMGLPPHAYQNQLRVELGKRLLSRGTPISQVAVEAGFVDQSHFSRVFKQYTGATPRQYQTVIDPND
ncbi:MAG: AraC family transcriptional regulator [Pseudodesulfovibrio sp.]|nr:AraC family transcriptional regulator [Pseudodesulfovibrio sp.]